MAQQNKGRDWSKAPLDAGYFMDSGMLFAVNKTFFHLLGISLVISRSPDGKLVLSLKDNRAEPETLVFDKSTMIVGQEKFDAFMQEFGHAQIDRRCRKLGWACQPRTEAKTLEKT